MKWQRDTLGAICDRAGGSIQTGPFGSQLHQSDYRDEGTPVVMPQDIVDDRIRLNRIAFVDETMADRLSRHRLKTGDIVFPRRGDISKRALISDAEAGYLCGTGCLKIACPTKELDPRFLYLFLSQPDVVSWIEGKAIGATMPNLNTGILRGLEIVYPDLVTQTEISGRLIAFQSLAENYKQQVLKLEEAARLIYTEWFVRQRFPGHEKAKTSGSLPDGWRQEALGQRIELNYGKSLKESERQPGEIPVFGSSGIVGSHASALSRGPGIVVGRKGNVGSIFYSPVPFFAIDTVYFIHPEQTTFFLLHALQRMNFISSDAAVPGLNRNYAYSQPVVWPSDSVLSEFEATCAPIYEQITTLEKQIAALKSARDLLLPRLISGQLRI